MNYQLIAFDMDGTLLDTSKGILPSTLEAIREAAARDKTIAIATGRSPSLIAGYAARLPEVRYAICITGAGVYDLWEHRFVTEEPLPAALVPQVLDAWEGEDAMSEVFSGTEIYQPAGYLDRLGDFNLANFRETFANAANFVPDIREWALAHAGEIAKYNLHCRSTEMRERIRDRVVDRGLDVEWAYTEWASLELTARGVSKGRALEGLCRHLGIPVEASIAVGDSGNDLDMVRRAGLGVAMGNASPDVLEAADVVVADNDHGGCAEAVHSYLLA
jgi:Cof subfamily protein (haloacid dehalogenase superfamily)